MMSTPKVESHLRWLRASGRGFSLVEVMVVMAILLILFSLTVMSISSIAGGTRLRTALAQTAGYVDLARSYAVGHGTYVYLGWWATNNGRSTATVRLAMVSSATGDDLSSQTNLSTNTGNVILVGNPLIVSQVLLETNVTQANPDLYNPHMQGTNRAGSALSSCGQTFNIGGQNYQTLLAFGPSGTVIFGGVMPSMVEFGLRLYARTNLAGIIQIRGITGQSHVYQQ